MRILKAGLIAASAAMIAIANLDAVTRVPSADGQFWDIQDTSPWAQDSGGIATGGRARAIAVPRDAVQTLEGKTVVFVEGEHAGEFEAREVEAGQASGERIVIAEGLHEGDRVVTKGAFTVKSQAMKSELGEGHGH